MEVEKQITIPLAMPSSQAWALVQQVNTLVPCMPGASIEENIDENHFKAAMAIKIGPVNAKFIGDIEIALKDPSAQSMTIVGTGRDSKGTSTARMKLQVDVKTVDDRRSEIQGRSVVNVSGKFATFGGRLLSDITDRLLSQFSEGVKNQLESEFGGIPQTNTKQLNIIALLWDTFRGWLSACFTPAKNPRS